MQVRSDEDTGPQQAFPLILTVISDSPAGLLSHALGRDICRGRVCEMPSGYCFHRMYRKQRLDHRRHPSRCSSRRVPALNTMRPPPKIIGALCVGLAAFPHEC
jgi:hypothetical protein